MIYSETLNTYIFESIEEMEENADLPIVNEYIYDKIHDLIKSDEESTILFYINVEDMVYSTVLKRESVIPPLQTCLKKFEEAENYEMCSKCLNLINSLDI
jgi:hypothetical protein